MTGTNSPKPLTNLNHFIRHVKSNHVPSPKQIERRLKNQIEGVEDLMFEGEFDEEHFMNMNSNQNINIIHTNTVNLR